LVCCQRVHDGHPAERRDGGGGTAGFGQKIPPELGKGWLGEFDLAARQTAELAEAIPAEKYSWRPGPGVGPGERRVRAHRGYECFLLGQAGVRVPSGPPLKLQGEREKTLTTKAEVIALRRWSQDMVRAGYPKGGFNQGGQIPGQRHHRRRRLLANPCACSRAHGATGGVRADDRSDAGAVAVAAG
jgi:hypothetical protein